MILEAWHDIVSFFLTLYSSKEALSKYNTIKRQWRAELI